MVTNREVVEQARLAASDALDRLVAFLVASGCSDDDAIEASRLLIEPRGDEPSKAADRATWERSCANDLLMGAWAVMQVPEPDDGDEIDTHDGYRLLRKGDRAGALDAADAMLREAEVTEDEGWDYGNLVHHGHILCGTISSRTAMFRRPFRSFSPPQRHLNHSTSSVIPISRSHAHCCTAVEMTRYSSTCEQSHHPGHPTSGSQIGHTEERRSGVLYDVSRSVILVAWPEQSQFVSMRTPRGLFACSKLPG